MQPRNYMKHNTDIPELTNWVVEYIDEGYCTRSRKKTDEFGCGCDNPDQGFGYAEIWEEDGEINLNSESYYPDEIDEYWLELLAIFKKYPEYDLFKIGIYHCHNCGKWSIDGDW